MGEVSMAENVKHQLLNVKYALLFGSVLTARALAEAHASAEVPLVCGQEHDEQAKGQVQESGGSASVTHRAAPGAQQDEEHRQRAPQPLVVEHDGGSVGHGG